MGTAPRAQYQTRKLRRYLGAEHSGHMSACLLSEAGNHHPVYHDGIFLSV
jgi:hypothetical protein